MIVPPSVLFGFFFLRIQNHEYAVDLVGECISDSGVPN